MSFWRQLWILVQGLLMVALAAAVAFLVFGLGIPGVLEPPIRLEEQRDTLRLQLENLQRENELVSEFARDPERGPREMKTLQQQRVVQRRIVPDEPQLETFQATVKKDAAAAGMRLLTFPAPKVIAHDYYGEQIVKAELEGSYDAVQAFLKRVQREERVITVYHVLVTSPAPPYTLQHRIVLGAPVHLQCELVTYYRRPPAPAHR